MKKLLPILIPFLVITFALYLRTNNLPGKLTFEWDQERDLQAVQEMLTTRQPTLLGPIVRGDTGGFYLAPFYYYLITPLYLFFGGNPLSLSLVSIGADMILIFFLFQFLRSRTSTVTALATAILWAGSPLVINNAYTPWNVSFIPLWTLAAIWTLESLFTTPRLRYKLLLVFLTSLVTSIHLSLVPIAILLLIINWRRYLGLPLKQYFLLALTALLPISPLILYDLTHRFANTILLKQFLFGVGTNPTTLGEIIPLIVEKYGYTLGRLFTGEPLTLLGLVILAILTIFALKARRRRPPLTSSLVMIATLLLSLVIYRDPDFAEYYFIPTFVPIVILLGYFLHAIPGTFRLLAVLTFLILYSKLGLTVRATSPSPYSLAVKRQVVEKIKQLGYPVEFRTSLPRERNTGFTYLLKDVGVTSDPNASRKAYIYESGNLELIAPEEARSIILNEPFQAFKLVVFSN